MIETAIKADASPDLQQNTNYIADMALEMIKMVPDPRAKILRYLLAMAQLEANRIAKDSIPATN